MDKVVIKKNGIVQKCGTCIYGKAQDLQNIKPPNGFVWCAVWNALKPFNGWCGEWKN